MKYIECQYEGCGDPVFSSGICRKHYEQEKLERASPCSISGCGNKAYRGTLCSIHYRAKIKATHPTCTVPGCTEKQKTLKSGLCEKHLFRYTRHGSIEQTRPADWGAKEKHPLYDTWHWHRRKNINGLVLEWASDFWAFADAVGERPDQHKLRKINENAPLGPGNWEWREITPSSDKAYYAREWRKKNPDKSKNNDLKKTYGITLDEYDELLNMQQKVCAICGNPETAVDNKGHIRMMPVDHCHRTGKIRGLLCTGCNTALGGFKDDIDLLEKAIKYLKNNEIPDSQKPEQQ